MDDIKLTPQELEEIKDTIKFREKTSLQLKNLYSEIKKLCDVPLKVGKLEAKVFYHRLTIFAILGAIIGIAIKAFAR